MPEAAGTDRGSELLAALQDPEHFRVLVQDVQLAAVFLDPSGRVAHCNPFLLRLTGWDRDEIEGHDWFDRFLPPTERDELRRRFVTKVAAGNIAPLVLNHIVTRRGEKRLLRWSNTLLRARDGEGLDRRLPVIEHPRYGGLGASRLQRRQHLRQRPAGELLRHPPVHPGQGRIDPGEAMVAA